MDTNIHELTSKVLLKDEVYQIVGLIFNFGNAKLEWERLVL
jgi:hypothetical protein